jgi:hypothetical protein
MSSLSAPVPSEITTYVRALVADLGLVTASQVLNIGREATARIMAGLGVRRGTLALAEQSLRQQRSSNPRGI